MSQVFFTSDLHLGHAMVAELRGFSDLDIYHEHIASVWNASVTKRDVVWNLGDVTLGPIGRVREVLEALNGTHHLVSGNHDKCHPMHRGAHNETRKWLEVFATVQPYARYGGALMSHFPYTGEGRRDMTDRHVEWRMPDYGVPLIHGHTHDAQQRESLSQNGTRMLHVGWDAWGGLVPLKTVQKWLDNPPQAPVD